MTGGLHPEGLHPEGLHTGGSASGGGWADPSPLEHYRIQSISGRYASYWNAFLFKYLNRFEIMI